MPKIIIASGPIIVENNKVLLNNHGDTNFWKFCGGQVEDFDSNLIEAAQREVKEEMGIDIKIVDEEPFITHTKKGDVDVILVHFLAERVGEIKPGDDIREWQWFEVDKLPDKLAPNILTVLKHFKFL
jgi:8-oxo-dGTP pyrophosphatase MutT (NUDIX family)